MPRKNGSAGPGNSVRSYLDSDVLVWWLRGDRRAADFLQALDAGGERLWIGAMQRVELLFFAQTPAEVTETHELLMRFETYPLTEEVADLASVLYRQWNPS